MGITIIIKDGKPRGRNRTKIEKTLKDEWGVTTFRTPEDADKCAYIERKLKKHFGADDSQVRARIINEIK